MRYYSQIGQDKYYIENISNNKKNGIFLDIGANDGIYESNTATLEFDYGWSGVCVEANPYLIDQLKLSRPNSKVINCAAWRESGTLELEISHTNCNSIRGDLLSRIKHLTINQNYFQNHFDKDTEIIEVVSKTITEIVTESLTSPYHIDYMSLDIEGAELEALQGINFSLINIDFMSIEHGNRQADHLNSIINYLQPFNYIVHRINQWDVEFERTDIK